MSGVPSLSAVIVSFDCRERLAACLASLEAERASLPLEVIVVDNASTDGTPAFVRRHHPDVVLVAADANLGFARATNAGIARATGEHLLVLNPDTVVPKGALRAAVEELERRPAVGMLGVRLVQEDGTLDHACKRGFPTPLGALAYFLRAHRLFPRSRIAAAYTAGSLPDDETGLVDAVSGAFMLVRRRALDDVGLLDEDYWLYMEDLDWCYRFWASGWPVLYWPGATVVHAKGGSSGRNRDWRTNRAFHAGMWLFYRKHYRTGRFRALAGLVWLGIVTRLSLSATRSAIWRAVGPTS